MRKRKVAIIIDDEKFIRTTLSKMLSKLNYKTKLYASALDLIDTPDELSLFVNTVPDVLIVDIVLPGMTGIEFLQKIKMKGYELNKVALMSGHYWGDDLEKMANDLNCKHFEKPFSFEDIKEWLNE